MESVHDSDSDDEFTDKQKAEFLSNLVVEHEKLIKSYLKIIIFFKLIKTRLKCLMDNILIYLKKNRFLKSNHHSLLEKNNALTQEINISKSFSFVKFFYLGTSVLNEILDKCKTHCDKRDLGYINIDETPSSGINLIKSLEVNLVPLSHYLGLNKLSWERIGLNVKLCSMHLKIDLPVSGTWIMVALDIWLETKPFSHL